MCPPIALLDLERVNYILDQSGERRRFVISRGADLRRQLGWRNHGASINFSVFTTVSQQDVPEGINNRGKQFYVQIKKKKCLFYCTFIFDSYSFGCWEEFNMTAVSLPPVTMQL